MREWARDRWFEKRRRWARRIVLVIAGEESMGSRIEWVSFERVWGAKGFEPSWSIYSMFIVRVIFVCFYVKWMMISVCIC